MLATSVIVPAFNAGGTLARTLECLAVQDLAEPYEVIVVDDGSDDDTIEIANGAPGAVTVLRQRSVGPGEARNRGARAAQGRVLAFTDSDCYPAADWLRHGLAALEHADLVQGRVVADPHAPLGPFDRTIWIPHETGLYETANLFVTRERFRDVGGFEDWLEVTSGKLLGEDVWFGWKARRQGATVAFAPDALVHHAVFPQSAQDFIGERKRLVYFPALVRKIPELRQHFLYRRVFLSRRSAALDAALLGLAAAALLMLVEAPLAALVCLAIAVVPYARMVWGRMRRFGRLSPKVAAAEVCADLTGLVYLLRGSIKRRSLVI